MLQIYEYADWSQPVFEPGDRVCSIYDDEQVEGITLHTYVELQQHPVLMVVVHWPDIDPGDYPGNWDDGANYEHFLEDSAQIIAQGELQPCYNEIGPVELGPDAPKLSFRLEGRMPCPNPARPGTRERHRIGVLTLPNGEVREQLINDPDACKPLPWDWRINALAALDREGLEQLTIREMVGVGR